MSDTSWRQILYAKRSTNVPGEDGGYRVLTGGKAEKGFISKILKFRSRHCPDDLLWFVVDGIDHVFIGLSGLIPDILGKDCPYGHEPPENNMRGREITFVHGYYAPKGTQIPNFSDLAKTQPRHLEEILRRLNGGEDPVSAASVSFQSSHVLNTDWDSVSSELQKGNAWRGGATFTKNGKLFRMLEISEGAIAAEKSPIPNRQPVVRKKTFDASKISRTGFLKVISVAVVAVIAGIAAWNLIKLLKDKHKNKGETPQNSR